jgi:uncharacterized protein (TIGR03437 family)
MRRSVVAWLALLSATAGLAQSSGFLLGVDYIEYADAKQIATDSAGNLYVLGGCPVVLTSCVTKLSADGKAIVWQNTLAFVSFSMAVNPGGGVYVIPESQAGDTSVSVAKLGPSGSGIAWQTPVGFLPAAGGQALLAADSQGRAYVAGTVDATNGVTQVVRLNATGTGVDYTARVTGAATSLAVDGVGGAFVAGNQEPDVSPIFLARLAPDGSAGFYSALPVSANQIMVAVDPKGDAVVYANAGVLFHFDARGAVASSVTVTAAATINSGLALDAAGNAYIIGTTKQLYPVRNSLATCNSIQVLAVWLTVLAPDNSILQTSYVPNAVDGALIVTGANSMVFIVAPTFDFNIQPTQSGPWTNGWELLRLSLNGNPQVLPLACMGNSATYNTGPIAPGGFVTLFGSGLGPQQGVRTTATPQIPFPTEEANVEVTFDGTPAPLLWVQDAQINVLAPWSLTPGKTTQVCASYNKVTSNCLTWPVAQTDPAVFMLADGIHAAALNQDGTVNSANNPAAPGSVVTVFATGLGPITPPQADGALVGIPPPTNVLPVQVQAFVSDFFGFENIPYTVTYAGPKPSLVAGMSEISFQLVDDYWGAVSVYLPSTQSQTFQVYEIGQ